MIARSCRGALVELACSLKHTHYTKYSIIIHTKHFKHNKCGEINYFAHTKNKWRRKESNLNWIRVVCCFVFAQFSCCFVCRFCCCFVFLLSNSKAPVHNVLVWNWAVLQIVGNFYSQSEYIRFVDRKERGHNICVFL